MLTKRLGQFLYTLEDIFAWAAIALLLAITTAVCLEVVMRYAFNSPIFFVVEMSEYALLWITFLGTAWTLRNNGHVRVEIVLNFLSSKWRHRVGLASSLFGIIVSLVLVIFGISRTWDAFERGLFHATITEFPTWIVMIFIPVGSIPLLFRFVQRFVGHWNQSEADGDDLQPANSVN